LELRFRGACGNFDFSEHKLKAVILACGLGTRISEKTHLKPKPMIEIGGKPILWHIMKLYSAHGVNDFVICCGYKGYVIKEYFANYCLHMSDVTFDMHDKKSAPMPSPCTATFAPVTCAIATPVLPRRSACWALRPRIDWLKALPRPCLGTSSKSDHEKWR
jgi:molybdopterin-guanine dinucleotide biosynthesis protein A